MVASLRKLLVLRAAAMGMVCAIAAPQNTQPAMLCLEKVTPTGRTCTVPPAKSQQPTLVADKAKAVFGITARQEPAPTGICRILYVTSTSCFGSTESAYTGNLVTISMATSTVGAPPVTTTMSTTAQISLYHPAQETNDVGLRFTEQMRIRILDIADDFCDKAGEGVKTKRQLIDGDISHSRIHAKCDFSVLPNDLKIQFKANITNLVDAPGMIFYDPNSFPSSDDPNWALGSQEYYTGRLVAELIGECFERLCNFMGWFQSPAPPAESLTSSTSSPSASTVTNFDTAGNQPSKSSSSTITRSGGGDPGDQWPEDKPTTTTSTSTNEGPSCPTDAVIDPNDDQGQDGSSPDFCEAIKAPTNQSKRDGPESVCLCQNGMSYIPTATTMTTNFFGTPTTTVNQCPWTTDPPSSVKHIPNAAESSSFVAIQSSLDAAKSSMYSRLSITEGATPMSSCDGAVPSQIRGWEQPGNPLKRACEWKNDGDGTDWPKEYCSCTNGLWFSTTSITLTTCQNGYTDTTVDLCPATRAPPNTEAIDNCKFPEAVETLCSYRRGVGYDLPQDICECPDGRQFLTSESMQTKCSRDHTVTDRITHPCGWKTTPASNLAVATSTQTAWGQGFSKGGAIQPALPAATPSPFCLEAKSHPGWSAIDMDTWTSWACKRMADAKAKLGKTAHGKAFGLFHSTGKIDSVPDRKLQLGMLMKNAPDSCLPGLEEFDFVSGQEECQDILYDLLGRGCDKSSKMDGGREYFWYHGGAVYHNCVYYELAPLKKFTDANIPVGWREKG